MKWMQGKGKWLVLLCAFMVIGTGMTVPASGSLKIRLDHGSKESWTEGIQVPDVTVNYSQESPGWSKAVENWLPGKPVTATLRVNGTFTRSDCTIYGGSLISVKAEDGETEIKVSYIPAAMLGGSQKAGWSDSTKTKASWTKVPFASRYQVVLYGEGGIWIKSLTTSSVSVDLLPYMEGDYTYYYTVKAILKDSSEEEYLKEGEAVSSDDSVVQESGDTSGTWTEYQNGKKYRGEDGNYVVSQWKMISGKWYYFNKEAFAVVGWQLIEGKWYYMGANAQMVTGWQQINGKWYYLNEDGDMAIGWIQPQPGKWYYLYRDGSLAVNTKVGGIYRIDASGLWVP
jgi:hypothetical protein